MDDDQLAGFAASREMYTLEARPEKGKRRWASGSINFAHRALDVRRSLRDLSRRRSLIIVVWAVSGPFFGFSETWQLVINTGTTIVTFLMVFLIQNTQNRDGLAMQLKLDELIRATEDGRQRHHSCRGRDRRGAGGAEAAIRSAL